jgi:predicted Zn-dependent peptidase
MKKYVFLPSFAITIGLLFTLSTAVQGQAPAKTYKYESVPNDPLNARIYKLDNGLTVYMTVYKNAPRIQTYIAVRAGSKNDPQDATGLAHYLEHLLFKGTDKYGTKDYAKEKVELDKIEALFEVYRKTTDETKRKAMYHVIDSISGYASKFAIPNEYVKMVSSIGAKGTNANTWLDRTIYVNDIPSNQLDKWTTIEAERFRNPVLRLFHTELEAVYEEKNRTLDNDDNKSEEVLYHGLFPNNTYGSQTTIGTIDHLKNPSLTKIKKYFNAYYVPNNIAICLSGDFDPDATIKLIDEKFGNWKSKPLPVYQPYIEKPITQPIVSEVLGPKSEDVTIGYRLGGANTKDADMLLLVDEILANGKAGLIDLDLNQQQKTLKANSESSIFKDYSIHTLSGSPKTGQSLEQVKDLLLAEIEKVKKGDFPDWLLGAIINNLKLRETRTNESNRSRANAFVLAFINNTKWQDYTSNIDRLSKITKQEVVDFVKKNYTSNYVVVYKRIGEDKTVKKVTKPSITPIQISQTDQSDFAKMIFSMPSTDIQPVFLDYNSDIKKFSIKNDIQVLYTANTENKTFNMIYLLDMGKNQNKKLGIAVSYLKYLGTKDLTAAQVQEEFFKLACSFDVNATDEEVSISLNGLSENMEKATKLLENLLANAQPNEEALKSLIADVQKSRADAKLDKNRILQGALYSYVKYGKHSPFTNVLSTQELQNLSSAELIALINELNAYQHRILYYGNSSPEELTALLNKEHKTPATLKPVPPPVKFTESEPSTNVYVVNYDMKQAEVILFSKDNPYNKDIVPQARMFNEYFGGSMSSVVFQEIRESKALAYSVSSNYYNASKKTDNNFVYSYIGTQADKLPEAMSSMMEIINNMPESENKFATSKESILQGIRSERITKMGILLNYESAKKLGLDYDIRKDIYAKVPTLSFAEVKAFEQEHLKGKQYNVLALGKKESLDLKSLEKYGQVTFLTLEDIFGY